MTREDRELLAAVNRWARTNGWSAHRLGWANAPALRQADATLAVRTEPDMWGITVYHRQPGGVWPTSGTYWPVSTIREGVDVLCALRILPAWLSTQWQAGVAVGVELGSVTTPARAAV